MSRVGRGRQGGGARPSRRQENLRVTSELAQQARRRAQTCFLSMIEGPVEPKVFIAKARYINPEVYDDVVVERAVAGLCGYPPCPNTFIDSYGSRTYVIRSNRLYDVTDRRKYCSNVCFEASELVRKQVLTLPLYLRDTQDSDIKDVRLPSLTSLKGRHGKQVDVTGGISQLELEEEEKARNRKATEFMTIDNLARESLINWSENENDKKDLNQDTSSTENKDTDPSRTTVIGQEERCSSQLSTIGENQEHEPGQHKEGVGGKADDAEVLVRPSEGRNNGGDPGSRRSKEGIREATSHDSTTEESPAKTVTQEHETSQEDNTNQPVLDPLADVHRVEAAMREWVSFDSLRLVLGDRYVRGMLEHLGHSWDNYDTTAGLRLSVEAKARYISICRRLEHEEREDGSEEGHDGEHKLEMTTGKQGRPTRPLPDYATLQHQAKKHQLKVVSFFGGSDQYEEPVDAKLDSIPEEEADGGKATSKKKVKPKKQVESSDSRDPTLPFVDSYSQVAWRQSIVVEKVMAYLQQLLTMTQLLSLQEVKKLLAPLITSFHLSPNNISFQPRQWRLITLILLKMLSVRYPVIQEALKGEEGVGIQRNILGAFSLDLGYCDRILSYLTEIQHVLSKDFKDDQAVSAAPQSSQVLPTPHTEGEQVEVSRKSDGKLGTESDVPAQTCSQKLAQRSDKDPS